jgi:predicted esterase
VSGAVRARRDLGYEHALVPGPGAATLLLLHSTGGDEHQLVELGRRLAPRATLLSPRGKELENGVTRRFFRRHEALRDGVLAFIDLDVDMEIEEGVVEVTDLVEFAERREQMGYPPGLLSAVVLALDRALDRQRRGDWPFDGSLR